MKLFIRVFLVIALLTPAIQADEAEVAAVLEKAIKALGGEAKLTQAETVAWKSSQLVNGNVFVQRITAQGVNRYRLEMEREINGNLVKCVSVVNGDNHWGKVGDTKIDINDDMIAKAKQGIYLQVVTMTILPLKKDKGFKVESAGEEKVGDDPAAVLKVTDPDGKTFKLSFSKDSGLLVKSVVTSTDAGGVEYTLETTYSDYKEFDGIKRFTKSQHSKDGRPATELTLSEFKILDNVDPETFAEPK